MPIRSLAERQALAAKYVADNPYAFIAAADPGSGPAVANEATGGPGPYARVGLAWSAPDINAIVTATAVFSLPAGTFTYGGTAATLTGDTLRDASPLPTQYTNALPGPYTLSLTYQQQ